MEAAVLDCPPKVLLQLRLLASLKGVAMLAYRLVQARALAQPEFHELPEPHAGLGEIVVEVGGSVPFDFFKVPPGAQLVTSLNGGSVALREVVDMAALGRLKILEIGRAHV